MGILKDQLEKINIKSTEWLHKSSGNNANKGVHQWNEGDYAIYTPEGFVPYSCYKTEQVAAIVQENKKLTEQEDKLIALAALVAGVGPGGEGNEYSMNDTGILIRCKNAAMQVLEEVKKPS